VHGQNRENTNARRSVYHILLAWCTLVSSSRALKRTEDLLVLHIVLLLARGMLNWEERAGKASRIIESIGHKVEASEVQVVFGLKDA